MYKGWIAIAVVAAASILVGPILGQSGENAGLKGTLVIAVPVKEGLVVCADKRIYNADSGAFTDDFVKIRQVSNNALFVATNTVGLYDSRKKRIAFDAFAITESYTAKNNFDDEKSFWNGLKKTIAEELRRYLAERKYSEWPDSDKANNNLLFNLIFYSVHDGKAFSHSMKVFYEKAKTPVVFVEDPVRETITKPKLSGKGREVMNYLSRNAAAARDPLILQFDENRFDRERFKKQDAVEFSRKLFQLTSTGVPQARVSATFDCAALEFAAGFRLIDAEAK